MRQATLAQHVDTSDPQVAYFLAECGVIQYPVQVRLMGKNADDLMVQIKRLTGIFGDMITFSQPKKMRQGYDWAAYGTIHK